jgi:hypothetical protein
MILLQTLKAAPYWDREVLALTFASSAVLLVACATAQFIVG